MQDRKAHGQPRSSAGRPVASATRRVHGHRPLIPEAYRDTLAGPAGTDRRWYRIHNQVDPGAAAEVYVYDEIGMWGLTASAFIDELRAVAADRIDLHLNSPGGDVFDGIAILNALRAHQAEVTVYVDSIAASIASVIAMGGDRVVMARNSQLMIHDAFGLCVGNADEMREMAERLDRHSDNIAAVYNEKAGGGVKSWRARMRAESWFTAEEAVAAGLADEVAAPPVKRDDAVPTNRWDLSIFRYAGREAAPSPDGAGSVPVRDAGGAPPVGAMSGAPTGGTPAAPPTPEPTPAPEPAPAAAALDDIDLDGVDLTDAIRSAFDDDFDQAYDPDVVRAALRDPIENAPAPPPTTTTTTPAPPGHVPIDQFSQALWEALQ